MFFRDPAREFQKDVTITLGPYPDDARINVKVTSQGKDKTFVCRVTHNISIHSSMQSQTMTSLAKDLTAKSMLILMPQPLFHPLPLMHRPQQRHPPPQLL